MEIDGRVVSVALSYSRLNSGKRSSNNGIRVVGGEFVEFATIDTFPRPMTEAERKIIRGILPL